MGWSVGVGPREGAGTIAGLWTQVGVQGRRPPGSEPGDRSKGQAGALGIGQRTEKSLVPRHSEVGPSGRPSVQRWIKVVTWPQEELEPELDRTGWQQRPTLEPGGLRTDLLAEWAAGGSAD